MVLCVLCINYNTVSLGADTSEVLSGLQLFLTYNSLLQYWGTFASIGYYRHRTIKKPGLNLRSRRQLVTRCVACNWVISSLLAMTLSLSYARNSRYAMTTLDPFMRDYLGSPDERPSYEEHVAVTLVILMAFSVGLGIILTAYYNICRTLNVVSAVGRNRISPRQQSPNIHSDSTDLTLSVARSYRPQYTISAPSYLGGTLSRDHKETFIVIYNKHESTATIEEHNNGDNKQPKLINQLSANTRPVTRSAYGQRRQLSSTLSNASSCSVRSKAPEFTDISIGADLLRFQRQQNHTLQRRQSFRRESISLSNAIRNSLAMLIAYCTCSLPLIVVSVPEPAWTLTAVQRLHVLLFCRMMFYLNAPVYPLWYLSFSVTVKKCFTRLWESFVSKYRTR